MSATPIYLDHNATTPVHPAVREAMLPWLGAQWGNPSSAHAYGRDAARALADARAQVAELVGADPDEVLFTSGGTEADNLAILGAQLAIDRVALSSVEHPAVAAAVRERVRRGATSLELPVDREGRVELGSLREPVGLLSVMLAQNETGVIQPVGQLAKRARAAHDRVLVHCDGAQAVGKIPVDVRALDVDMLTIVGHKFYAPAGIGALVVRRGTSLTPTSHGGGQERGLRSGTEPVALAVALGAACALARNDLDREPARQLVLREQLWNALVERIPDLVRTGASLDTLPNTLHVRVPGLVGAAILAAAPEVAASTGSACHSEHDGVSGVLGAMGVPAREAMGALRLSLGRATTREDITRAAAALADAVQRMRS
ncbi:MAG TPA: cysteine desulfurase family protein [Nannocystaceae bacterium]|nr:cysteine desulfurase family protein [Nannocystaceae bacterium]